MVASFFTFLRWLVWVNIILTVLTLCFIVTPEVHVGFLQIVHTQRVSDVIVTLSLAYVVTKQVMAGDEFGSTERKSIPESEQDTALNIETVWNFEVSSTYNDVY